MTHLIDPNGLTQREIALQTRRGNQISNIQIDELSAYDLSTANRLQQQFLLAEFRTSFIPIYNCHGMTFGARRTSITESSEVRKILSDDEYEEVRKEDILPGDVIIYVDDRGDIEHSGIVVSKPTPPICIPMVVSKWGKGPEVLHSAYHSPYSNLDIHFFRVRK